MFRDLVRPMVRSTAHTMPMGQSTTAGGDGGGSSDGGGGSGGGDGGASYRTETTALSARAVALGSTDFSGTQKAALDAFFAAASASSWWAKTHSLRMRLHTEIASEIDLVDQATAALRSSPALAWSRSTGWALASTSGRYLDLRVDPVAVIASINSLALMVYLGSASGSNLRDLSGADAAMTTDADDLFVVRRQNRITARLATSGNVLQNVGDSAPGFSLVSRTGATQIDYYVGDGSNAGSDSDVPTGLSARGLAIGDPDSESSDRSVLGAGLFDGLTAVEALSLRNAVVALETAFRD